MDVGAGMTAKSCCVATTLLLAVFGMWALFLSHSTCVGHLRANNDGNSEVQAAASGAASGSSGPSAIVNAKKNDLGASRGDAAAATNSHFLSDEDYFVVMANMPIPTVDVLLVDKQRTKTLLFKRSNKPVQHVYYSLGGRIYKNERVEDAAVRKLQEEIGITCSHPLQFVGMVQEIFEDSMFDGSTARHPEWNTNSHCYNSVFYCEVHPELLESKLTFDGQHDDFRWFSTASKELHPLMQEKVKLVKAHTRQVAKV